LRSRCSADSIAGQVFWVDFIPARGSEQAGRRPALIVQNDVGNRYSPNTIVAAMTTRVAEKDYPTEVRLPEALFGKPSSVLCAQLLTISQQRLVGLPVARLDAPTMANVDAALKLALGL
jgi:mRNA interferase MazF